jgi:peptide/nickel transport system permease protein
MLFYAFMATIWADMFPKAHRNAAPTMIRPFDWEYTQTIFGITVWEYPLGTNQFGQGILNQIVNAAPRMAELVLAGAVVSVGMAVIVGTTAGYKGGFVDDLLMGLTDIVLTIPGLPLVLLLAAVFSPKDPFILGMILAIDNWPGLARTLRSQVLTIRTESYVEADRAMGISDGSILSKDIVPQLMPYILINAATSGKKVIVEAVALYFLGFLAGSTSNWGRMMDTAYRYGAVTDLGRFYLVLWPMLALALLVFGLVMLAQGLDRIFNPRLRARHAKNVGGDEDDVESTDSLA